MPWSNRHLLFVVDTVGVYSYIVVAAAAAAAAVAVAVVGSS